MLSSSRRDHLDWSRLFISGVLPVLVGALAMVSGGSWATAPAIAVIAIGAASASMEAGFQLGPEWVRENRLWVRAVFGLSLLLILGLWIALDN